MFLPSKKTQSREIDRSISEPYPWFQNGSPVSRDEALKKNLRKQLSGFGLFTKEIQNFLYRKLISTVIANPQDQAKIFSVVKNLDLDKEIAVEITGRIGGVSGLIVNVCRQLETFGNDAEGTWISRDGPPFCWSRFKDDASDFNEKMHDHHLGVNGVRFKLRSGLLLGGRPNFPNYFNGCRCMYSVRIPSLE